MRSVVVEARFQYQPASRALRVHYTVRNNGAVPVAVIDRGDRADVAAHRLQLGESGLPVFERTDARSLSLRLAAQALSKPTPTIPPAPLAARLMPAASLDGELEAEMPAGVERTRLCIGVLPLPDASPLHDTVQAHGVEVGRVGLAAAATQTLVCSDWFELQA